MAFKKINGIKKHVLFKNDHCKHFNPLHFCRLFFHYKDLEGVDFFFIDGDLFLHSR